MEGHTRICSSVARASKSGGIKKHYQHYLMLHMSIHPSILTVNIFMHLSNHYCICLCIYLTKQPTIQFSSFTSSMFPERYLSSGIDKDWRLKTMLELKFLVNSLQQVRWQNCWRIVNEDYENNEDIRETKCSHFLLSYSTMELLMDVH